MERSRMEAFSDGVLAIIITIMVLNDIETVREAMMVVRDTALMRFQFVEMILLTYQMTFQLTGVTKMIPMKERWEKTYGAYYNLPKNWETDVECQRASIMKTRDIVNKLNIMCCIFT